MSVHSITSPLDLTDERQDEVPSAASLLAVEDLYRQYGPDLCRRIQRKFGFGPPDPEDVVQAAFARLASLKEPEQVRNPRGFLYTVACNIVFDHKRQQKRHYQFVQGALADNSVPVLDELTPERVIIHSERFEIVRRTIETLPHKQKIVLSLHRNHGRTYQQISDETGWSYGDVYRQMEAALASLTAALKGGGD